MLCFINRGLLWLLREKGIAALFEMYVTYLLTLDQYSLLHRKMLVYYTQMKDFDLYITDIKWCQPPRLLTPKSARAGVLSELQNFMMRNRCVVRHE